MKVKEILKLLPKNLLSRMSKEYYADYKSKKLSSENLLAIILYTMFSERFCTLRKLQQNFNNPTIQKKYLGIQKLTTIDHTAFHYRLTKINYELFKKIYEETVKKYKVTIAQIKPKFKLSRFDSTIVSLSEKLLRSTGFKVGDGKRKKKHIKYTVGYTDIPEVLRMHSTKSYTSENKALREAILETEHPKNTILLFDRGLSDRKAFDEIGKKNHFVTRLQKGYRAEIKTEEKVDKETETAVIVKEMEGYLYNSKREKTQGSYRIIHAKKKTEVWDRKKENLVKGKLKKKKYKGKTRKELEKEHLEEELIIITNLPKEEYSSEEVLSIYKKRWDIEVFFKFLKQELNFSHFVNRTENGMKVMMYLRMLYALLLLVYKSKNNLKGYKYVKSAMMLELQEEFVRFIIEQSGGNYEKWMASKATFW